MITQVAFQNYKSLRDVRIDLERFTIFVGPNGSGKSSILEGIKSLLSSPFPIRDPKRGLVSQLPPDWDQITNARSRGGNGSVGIAVEMAGTWYGFQATPKNQDVVPPPLSLGMSQCSLTSGSTTDFDGTWSTWNPKPVLESAPLPSCKLLRLEPSKLRSSQKPPNGSGMASDGSGLHSALADFALNEPKSWTRLLEDFYALLPTIRLVRHTKSSDRPPKALIFDTTGGDAIPAEQINEGTLLVLGLLATLYSPERPTLLLLDDLDRGLHPRAQTGVVELLRRMLANSPDLQILATTHSPYLLDSMKPEEVRITCLDDKGSTICKPLAEHPDYPVWTREMAPGEMWSMFGESWMTGRETQEAAW